MPDESDSPDHGRGHPSLSESEGSARPATDGDGDGTRSATEDLNGPEPQVRPAHPSSDGDRDGDAGAGAARSSPASGPAHAPAHMATSEPPPPPPLAGPIPAYGRSAANGISDPVGLQRPTGNGRDDTATVEERHGPPPPPITRPGTPPYIGPPEAMPRAPATDPAAGLPAAPYVRPGPVVGRQLRRRARRPVAPAPSEGRRIVHRLRQVSPWSVFKVAVMFYLCVFLMFMVAGVLLWKIGRTTESIDQVEELITRLGAYGRCVPEDEIDPGTDFSNDDDCPEGQVIVDGFHFDDGTLFKAALLGGFIFVVAGTAITVLLTILLNLLNDVTGGIRYETVREPGPERPNAPPASGAGPAPTATASLATPGTDGFGLPPGR